MYGYVIVGFMCYICLFMWSYPCVCHVYQYIVKSTGMQQVVVKLSPRVILLKQLIKTVSRAFLYLVTTTLSKVYDCIVLLCFQLHSEHT